RRRRYCSTTARCADEAWCFLFICMSEFVGTRYHAHVRLGDGSVNGKVVVSAFHVLHIKVLRSTVWDCVLPFVPLFICQESTSATLPAPPFLSGLPAYLPSRGILPATLAKP
ncbi:unnamed protein product, partial [Ectocarpus sp. 13 AM-2016]